MLLLVFRVALGLGLGTIAGWLVGFQFVRNFDLGPGIHMGPGFRDAAYWFSCLIVLAFAVAGAVVMALPTPDVAARYFQIVIALIFGELPHDDQKR